MDFVSDPWPPPGYRARVAEAVAGYLADDGRLSLPDGDGPVRQLEEAYRDRIGRAYALSFNSGTSALLAAYFGVGVGPGDEVLVAAYNYHAAASVLVHLGAVPVLCDVDPVTGELSLDDAERRLTTRTRALVVTHLYGHVADLSAVARFARRCGLRLVEDCSHAHGAERDGIPAGGRGDAVVFSLQENKLAPAGEGGILLTDEAAVHERAMALGHVNGRLHHLTQPGPRALAGTGLGLKLRIHPLAAVAGLVGLAVCAETLEPRRQAAKHLAELFAGSPVRFRWQPGSSYYLFRVLAPEDLDRAALDGALSRARERGIPLRRASLAPLYRHALFADAVPGWAALPGAGGWRRHRAGDFPGTERHVDRLLSAPTMLGEQRQADRESFAAAAVRLLVDAAWAARPAVPAR